MAWQLPSGKNKSVLSYLLIILAFGVLVFAIYLFFKFRINAIETSATPAYRLTVNISRTEPSFPIIIKTNTKDENNFY
jgi:hypothetical protein